MKRKSGQNPDVTRNWKPATLAVRGGTARSEFGETSEALFLTSGYCYDRAEDAAARFAGEQVGMTYSRLQNPTVEMLEQRIALLEGAEACRATATGMAAMTAALLCQLSAGDHVVAAKAAFGSCRWLVDTLLPKFGIETTTIDGHDSSAWEAAAKPNTKVFFFETPANPTMDVVDIAAVCAIANAHLLNDLERGALLGYDAPGGTSRGGNKSEIERGRGGHEASAAFGVLRKLVNDWLVDATERHNPHADALLGQLRRWLLSDDSALREPSLRHLVELCVRKTFTLLLAEMKKLGATVVFADARRVIVSTGKRRLANASAFVEGMRASLRKRELFSWLELEPVKQWHALLFRGPFDYGGLVASALPTASQWAGHDTQGPDDDELDPCAVNGGDGGHGEALDMHWNVASFLPESLREHFEVLVGEFIFRPWKRERGDGDGDAAGASAKPETVALDEEGDEALETAPRGGAPAEKQEGPGGLPLGREAAAAAEEARVAWLAGQIEGYFSQRILRLVGEIQKHLGPGSATRNNPEHRFPTPPGAHLSDTARGTPALAFVKTLCAVFGLDAAAAGPVALLRKNALKLLRVPEYAPEATFREPCVTFTLRDVVCEHCGDCRDVDLCRDERLVEDGTWECLSCDRAYDVEWVESTLVRRINERLRRTQTQDLRCARDGAIKVGRLASRCACGGLFKCVEHKRAAADDLRVMRSIAERHGFETLKDVVDWVDERSPNLER